MLETLISSSFDPDLYKRWLSSIFTTWNPRTLPAEYIDHNHVAAYQALGTTFLDDGRELAIFIFELKDNVDLEHNRVSLHKVLESRTKEILADGAIAVFYKPSDPSVWRFSFLRFTYDENDKQIVTASRRFTYLLGNGIAVKTAKEYLKRLAPYDMDKIQDAFSVERVSKEFFEEYRKLFEQVIEHLKPQKGLFDSDPVLHAYAKKLLGRIVFLYFLQKKGWMGAKKKDSWGSGDKNFISNLFRENPHDFYSKRLAPLFFETLNRKREHDYSDIFNSYIPFLNGGLFDEQKGLDDRVIIDDSLFTEIFGVFDRYNFTVIEDTPHDSEVAIDPEMLGRVFENLLEENYRKGKGAFYTPREIVHYMCRESLIDKLSQSFDPDAIKNLIIQGETDTPYIRKHAKEIETVVKSLKVLDPAIGSGAFPMGLLHELVAVLANLDKTADLAELKRSVIENSIYGVDIDPDAVEIAKLRFWLSLTVDEDTPSPLPNLFFKIMQGNSLIETIDGIDPIPTDLNAPKTRKEQKTLLSPIRQAWDFDKVDAHDHILVLTKKLHQFFQASDRELKQGLQEEIFSVIKQILDQRIDELKRNIATLQNDLAVEKTKIETPIVERKVKKLTDDMFKHENTLTKIEALKNSPISPNIFLYKLWFGEVLKEGGFDIVIGNPPYLRVQSIDKEFVEEYKRIYNSATGSFDLYVLFTEKAIKLIKQNGIANFIMPHKWANSTFGKGLRGFTKDKFRRFISFREYQVFNASTYTSLVWFQNNSKEVKYIGVDRDLTTNTELELFLNSITDSKYTVTPTKVLSDDSWTFSDNRTAKILAKLESQPLRVKDVFEKVFTGLQTSKDSVYFLSECIENDNLLEGYSKELDRRVIIEKGLVKPLLKGDDVHRYETLRSDKVVIFPYFILIEDDKEKAVLFTEQELEKKFPKGYKYLQECEEVLRDREKGSLKNDVYWYRYIYPKNLTLFDKEKLVMPYLSLGCQLSYDNGKFYGNTKCFGLIKYAEIEESYKYYLAILNSKLLWFFIQKTSAVFRGGYFTFTKETVEPFPLPKIDLEYTKPFEVLVDYIIWLKSHETSINEYVDNRHIAKEFEEVIDGLVYELYFEKEFKEKNLEFLVYAKRDFTSIENIKNDVEKGTIIHQAYQTLRERDNEIRNNLKLMNVRLPDLIQPIEASI